MSFFHLAKEKLEEFAADIKNDLSNAGSALESEKHSHTDLGETCHDLHVATKENRFHSFAAPRTANDAKWFVDGCGYMWAVSVALEEARESIWILDWWLSPELYLRRPPSANETYRIDRMLLAAAERGVKVNIIVYKEVSQLLTLCSEHTKKALELHPNISVFRHPDHAPSGQVLESGIISSFKNFSLKDFNLANLPEESKHALFGVNNDVVLYWAHHEKLCLIDSKIAFMGGLDLCFGRWDTNAHPIADAHPTNLENIIFPGQDFNNARVYDFEDVTKWENNKLDRTKSSRMGWSDLSMCLSGPVVQDLCAHFVQRWNFIYFEKYDVQQDAQYAALTMPSFGESNPIYKADGTVAALPEIGEAIQSHEGENNHHHHFHLPGGAGSIFDRLQSGFNSGVQRNLGHEWTQHPSGMSIQLVRSCSKWSHGVETEHSIANAYIEVIRESQHFVYIENQFFITATSDHQDPVKNKIGAALVERIVRAFQNGENYKVIVCMPSVPAFAGDLHADDSLGTRAIMEYQYFSICRGGNSIMEAVEKAGVPDAKQYIRFYNLRNYDRINVSTVLDQAEQDSGVSYESARREHDDIVGAGYDGYGERTGAMPGQRNDQYDRYQDAAFRAEKPRGSGYDSVCQCYMENGPSIKDIPWSGTPEDEINSFISEELYIHSKVLIADDRVVICGSANLNDRSQLGYHDSEIAVVIQDPTPVDSVMAGERFQASRFATSLRRQLFRKHLGLLPYQDFTKPDANFLPINQDPNMYDWGSSADRMVEDVLSEDFSRLWNGRASTNTEVFAKAFHPVPADNVRNWDDYKEFFGKYFVTPSDKDADVKEPPAYEYGHVVREEFPGGVDELKDWLDRVKGTLVEMPLLFMDGVDFAKEGLTLNAFTDEIYT
ncbi:phospholipase D [Coleophoma crateriformis]|uniref:Phospholipase n=1 Tax=Coleophoma crateriformis TaxID=565419 RepID=A0A3D8S9V5_9HELO|nr:phospholipase D [Coleophoma crateriformis]